MHTGLPATIRRTAWAHVRAVLMHPRLPLLAGLLAALLTLPSLTVGWVVDDLWHRMALKGSSGLTEFGILPSASIMELFRFLDGDARRGYQLMEIGILPWWSDPTIHGAFMRPVTAITHWLDYRLWPDRAALMHLHSVIWFAGLAASVAVLYRRMMGPVMAAGLAAMLYAMDDARGMPVGFLANRNAIVAGFFGVLALLAHDRWRRDGSRIAALAAPVLLGISLFSAEAGAGVLAYLLAYAIYIDRADGLRRFLALVPCALVVAAWRVVWKSLGYGVSPTMEFYVDPLVEPVRFSLGVFERAPMLLWGQWLGASDVAMMLSPRWQCGFWAIAMAFIGWVSLRLAPWLRQDSVARFWAVGMLLSLPPACATVPSDRMLIYVGIGAFGLLGTFLMASQPSWQEARRGKPSAARAKPNSAEATPGGSLEAGSRLPRSGQWLRRLLIAVHLVIAPIGLAVRSANPVGPRGLMQRLQQIVPTGVEVEGRDLILVNPPAALAVGSLPILRADAGDPLPRRIRVLGPSFCDIEVFRPDEQTLVVTPRDGYLTFPLDKIFRGPLSPLAPGARIELSGVTVEVLSMTSDGRPAAAAFHFDLPLEDPKWLWVQWKDGAYVTYSPPSVGGTMTLSRWR